MREHCLFLKQIDDAAALRKAIAYCFERANIPSLSKREVQDALSFVIVGAGPTGVGIIHLFHSFILFLLPLIFLAGYYLAYRHYSFRISRIIASHDLPHWNFFILLMFFRSSQFGSDLIHDLSRYLVFRIFPSVQYSAIQCVYPYNE